MNIDTEIELERLRNLVQALRLSNAELQCVRDGDVARADSWLQRKAAAQAKALDALNQRVINQRFVLRNLDRLGRSLSSDELAIARSLEGCTVELVAV
jgi:hypothetical protein